MPHQKSREKKRIPIRVDLLSTPLSPADQVRLIGSKCPDCNEILFGRQQICSNCGGKKLESILLGSKGKLWTYTVIRHKPPGDYKGLDPFVPFGLGLVELPEGIRILSPIQCELENIHIGMQLELEVYPFYIDEDNNEVMAFRFRPV
jgi:uncharacterized OB-fold protein